MFLFFGIVASAVALKIKRPAKPNHCSPEIHATGPASSDHAPVAVTLDRFAVHPAAADQAGQRRSRRLATRVDLPAVLAPLIQLRRVDPPQPDPLAAEPQRITIGDDKIRSERRRQEQNNAKSETEPAGVHKLRLSCPSLGEIETPDHPSEPIDVPHST